MFQHNYTILGNSIYLTAIVAAIPVFFLFWALAINKMVGWKAGSLTLLITIVEAVVLYKMPIISAISASVLGIANGLMPIGWIIVSAVFLFNLIVESGKFQVIQSSISQISPDRRIQAILIAYCFSHFLEGVSGMGAPSAIAAAMLIGLGFKPMTAALISLIGNIPPVPFGSVGVPAITIAKVAEIGINPISQAIGREMFIFSLIIPIFILIVMVGWKKTKEVLPAAFVAGLSFGIIFFIISNYFIIELTTILAALGSLIALVCFLKIWQPKTIWKFENDNQELDSSNIIKDRSAITKYSLRDTIIAWSPFIVIMILMYIWSSDSFRLFINNTGLAINIKEWPGLHGIIYRTAPIVSEPEIYAASYNFNYFGTVGTAIFISALLTIVILKIKLVNAVKVFTSTLNQLKLSLITMSGVIGFAYVANYSGMSYSYGLALASTGSLFIAFSPVIGALGTFLTGSVTSSGSLFGKLQVVTAEQIGINPVLTVSANLLGACIGKIISPQSIVIVAASTGLVGQESEILRLSLKYFFILLTIVIVVVLILAYIIPGVIPPVEYIL